MGVSWNADICKRGSVKWMDTPSDRGSRSSGGARVRRECTAVSAGRVSKGLKCSERFVGKTGASGDGLGTSSGDDAV